MPMADEANASGTVAGLPATKPSAPDIGVSPWLRHRLEC